jgi:hypothetical protein
MALDDILASLDKMAFYHQAYYSGVPPADLGRDVLNDIDLSSRDFS